MLNLTTPTAHRDAYVWAAVLAAHAAIGLVLTDQLHMVMPLWQAALVASAGYLAAWEVGVQHLGAGWRDALNDAVAVACGSAYAVTMAFAWPGYGWAVLAVFEALLAVGVWRRAR